VIFNIYVEREREKTPSLRDLETFIWCDLNSRGKDVPPLVGHSILLDRRPWIDVELNSCFVRASRRTNERDEGRGQVANHVAFGLKLSQQEYLDNFALIKVFSVHC
jgi:hypothetical protein